MGKITGPILVLDDNEGNRLLLEVALTTGGFEVQTAKTGEEALALAETTPFAVALVDINLPDADGLEIARRLRMLSREMVLIVVTIDDDDETVARARQADCDVFMTKPFDLDRLLDFMQAIDPVAIRDEEALVIVESLPGHQFRR